VEIGLVFGTGTQIEGEWATTVNPMRDVGASDIHGLRGSDLMDSPTFDEIAGSVLQIFNGRIPIAHNASFDRRFFASEMAHAGIQIVDSEWFCTMRAMSSLGVDPLSLEACCTSSGVALSESHEALADAHGCAGLVTQRYDFMAPEMSLVPVFAFDGAMTTSSVPRPRSTQTRRVERSLKELCVELPQSAELHPADTHSYLQLLTRVLEDRRITNEEYDALLACAQALSLSSEDVERIHLAYLSALQTRFLKDGSLSESENRDLDAVTALLGVSGGSPEPDYSPEGLLTAPVEDLAGMSVCFTGELESTICGAPISRSRAQELATNAGLQIKSGVSKKLDVLVVVDPDSLSGKARKARDLGVRIMAEQAFWEALDVSVD
ncbi:MAG: exonuclease domain-containing protein, partial [Solirubrobacterales bacterium]